MILDIAIVLIITMMGLLISKNTRYKHGEKFSTYLVLLWFFHLIMTLVFYNFIVKDASSDSMRFWRTASQIDTTKAIDYLFSGRGTQVMFAICFPLAKLGISFFSATFIFSFLGFYAIKIFFTLGKIIIPTNSRFMGISLFPWLFFLPNLHFWSAGVGKDTLLLLGIAYFSLAVSNLRAKWLYLIPAFIITALIRPHITLMLLLAYGTVTVFGSELKLYYKIFIGLIFIAISIFVIPKVLEISGMEEISVDQYNEFSQVKADQLSQAHTSSSIDISSYPLPLKVFSFLFRPTFIDINGIPALIAAFENLLLLILTVKILLNRPINSFLAAMPLTKYFLVFIGIGSVLFSLTLGNLGIMLRMRNMFLPGMLIYIMSALSYNRSYNYKINN